ncbi:MAG TPA: DNA topoisomerase, partial [Candidatus Paceibacterota bacterium]
PTNVVKESAGATDEQKRLYKLIWVRAVASQMADAKLAKTKITVEVDKGSVPDFSANGSRVMFDGWLAADQGARGEDVELPAVVVGDPLTLEQIDLEKRETQPPSRYTEAGLIKELERRGIGRPSTYASIMKTLADRGYVTKEGKTLYPTDTGDVVSSFLEQHFGKYISDSFTAEMENELDDIANGKREYAKTLADLYFPLHKEVESKEHIPRLTDLGKAGDEYSCPKCKSKMIIKLGKGGKFLSCARFPDCEGALTIDGLELKVDEPIGRHPEHDDDVFVLTGRFGPYVQLGKKTKENKKPRRASIPKDTKVEDVTLADAVKYLSLPRVLGQHPETGNDIVASVGRFGPYVMHDGDFRSLKKDDVYTIELPRALEILAEEKKTRRGRKKKTA